MDPGSRLGESVSADANEQLLKISSTGCLDEEYYALGTCWMVRWGKRSAGHEFLDKASTIRISSSSSLAIGTSSG